jgi:hypothetical protein
MVNSGKIMSLKNKISLHKMANVTFKFGSDNLAFMKRDTKKLQNR